MIVKIPEARVCSPQMKILTMMTATMRETETMGAIQGDWYPRMP